MKPRTNNPWPDAAKDRLKILWDVKSLTTEDIMVVLQDEGLITTSRNGVIGMAHRMKLPHRIKPPRTPRKRASPEELRERANARRRKLDGWTTRRTRPMPPHAVSPPAPEPPKAKVYDRRVSIHELDGRTCRFPHGTYPPYEYCGEEIQHGSPYCPGHHKRCFTPASAYTKSYMKGL